MNDDEFVLIARDVRVAIPDMNRSVSGPARMSHGDVIKQLAIGILQIRVHKVQQVRNGTNLLKNRNRVSNSIDGQASRVVSTVFKALEPNNDRLSNVDSQTG